MTEQTTEQAPVASVEDRIANLFAPKAAPQKETQEPEAAREQTEEATEAASDTPATADEIFELEVDGEKFALPKKLEKAVLQERDYTQKSQQNAQLRKQLEFQQEQMRVAHGRQEFEKSVASELQQLNAYEAVLADVNKVDWANMSTDEVMRKKIQIDQWRDQRDELARSVQAKYQQWEAKQKSDIQGLKTKATELASQFIPNWNEATQKTVRDHAISEGYTETELSQAELDPRHWKTLWKAQQFDMLKSKAAQTVKDVKSVKTTSSKPMPQEVKDKLAFRKQVSKMQPGSPEQQQLVRDRVAKLFGG